MENGDDNKVTALEWIINHLKLLQSNIVNINNLLTSSVPKFKQSVIENCQWESSFTSPYRGVSPESFPNNMKTWYIPVYDESGQVSNTLLNGSNSFESRAQLKLTDTKDYALAKELMRPIVESSTTRVVVDIAVSITNTNGSFTLIGNCILHLSVDGTTFWYIGQANCITNVLPMIKYDPNDGLVMYASTGSSVFTKGSNYYMVGTPINSIIVTYLSI